jgi:transglutaminase-like putative cysteine protease
VQRTIASHLECDVAEPVHLVLSVAAAHGPHVADESLIVTVDGRPLEVDEIDDDHGTRLHVVRQVPVGAVLIDYAASLTPAHRATPDGAEVEQVRYLRPSRYCESDRLSPLARAEFNGLTGTDLVRAVADWVHGNLGYVPGSSRPIDGAVATLLARQGVCRDFAHLTIAFLRACDVPARLASVYAPGLSPMDFHAVAEAFVDGRWHAVDATHMAPRSSLVRIATGRDAADTAFITSTGGILDLRWMEVVAYTDGDLPLDDHAALIELR